MNLLQYPSTLHDNLFVILCIHLGDGDILAEADTRLLRGNNNFRRAWFCCVCTRFLTLTFAAVDVDLRLVKRDNLDALENSSATVTMLSFCHESGATPRVV